MSSITKQRIGEYIYINESTSYWNSESKYPDSQKKSIGRIDPATGETYYKQWYIDRLKSEGEPTEGMKVWNDRRRQHAELNEQASLDVIELAREILGTVKGYGITYFLQKIAEKIGLLNILSQALPDVWPKIFVLACYIVAENKPAMYCSDWVDDNDCLEAGNMASQRISELFTMFGYNERAKFFRLWYQYVSENEYVALDITSVSSYSENIDFMEWGYNRDHDNLPQANICMLYGEQSALPIYQAMYSGSLGDVSTLEATLAEFSAITGTKEISLIMDKGFYSAKNVNMLLNPHGETVYKFLLPVSFTSKFPQSRVSEEKSGIDRVEHVILTSGAPIRGVYKLCNWGNSNVKVHTHIFFNPEKAAKDRNQLYGYVVRLKKLAMKNPNDKKRQKEFQRYLSIKNAKNQDNGLTVDIREDVLEKKLEFSGWFILISNHLSDIQRAYDLYRAKDVVEKSFFQYKNNLGLNRFHVHTDERVQNKTFVAFIALILSSHIHKVMTEKQLDEWLSFVKLTNILSKLKVATVGGITVLRPLTKDQKLIFDAFDIKYPFGASE